MNEALKNPRVTVIGGANLDLVGRPEMDLRPGESHPGRITEAAGGVGRNVAENLARLGVAARLLSVVGDDPGGDRILEDCRRSGVDVSGVEVVAGAQTPCYLAILDASGDLRFAVSQMELLERIDGGFLDDRAAVIADSSLIVADANLPRDALERLLRGAAGTPVFVDTVSAAKAERLSGLIGLAHTIKPNRAEAEVLSGMPIVDRGDLERAHAHFLGLGVRRVFISLGEGGMFFGDEQGHGHLPAPEAELVNATGSGDAAMAALAHAYLEGMSTEESAKRALAASALTLSHRQATDPALSVSRLESRMEEIGWR